MPDNVSVLSLVVPLADMPQALRMSAIRATKAKVLEEANLTNVLKSQELALRALSGVDVGLTARGWNEQVSATEGTGNTFEASAVGGGTAIARDRVIGIYGVYLASTFESVSGLRFAVGARRTHEWDLQAILHSDPMSQSRENRTMFVFPDDDGDVQPVIVPANTALLVEYYVRGSAVSGVQPADVILLGMVAEPMGGGGAGLQKLH